MGVLEKSEGPCVVLAGAGTGKTYTIVEKLRYLLKNKVYSPERIVCITFSNEAANNLVSRVRKLDELEEGKEPIIKTFHSFSADIIREHGGELGIDGNFSILDSDLAKVVLHSNFGISPYYCHKYISSIGMAKDLGVKFEDVEDYLKKKLGNRTIEDLEKKHDYLQIEYQTAYLKTDRRSKSILLKELKNISELVQMDKFLKAWRAYEKLKKKHHFQDYSDLNKNALEILDKKPEIRKDYDYVIVDEFQDTNKIQLDLIYKLAGDKKNITIVGDLNQSIYRFRGAYKENFNEFKKMFRVLDSDLFALDKSYRSTNKILKVAHKLILNNYQDKGDCFEVLSVFNEEGEKVNVIEMKNAKEEARKVLEIVKEEIDKGTRLEEICILSRTHQQARIFKNILELNKIEYSSINKKSLLKQFSVKEVINYLSILNKLLKEKKGGEQEWWDLFFKADLNEKDLIKIGRFLKENRESDCLSKVVMVKLSGLDLSDSGKLISRILVERINELLEFYQKDLRVHELLIQIFGIIGVVGEEDVSGGKERLANLNKFYEMAKEHKSMYGEDLDSFLRYLEVIERLDIDIPCPEIEQKGVRVMTLHATKGLEFEVVILTNMAEKRFPITRNTRNELLPFELHPEFRERAKVEDIDKIVSEEIMAHQLFEERRLCYVAFTRAKRRLFITYSKEYAGKKHAPSQFLKEIDYKANQDISFKADLEDKYEIPKVEFKPALNFAGVVNSRDFDSKIVEIIKSLDKAGNDKKEFPKNLRLSPSALLLFDECQKKYEYKYVYNMPDQKIVYWDAVRLGSFVHLVLEKGVSAGFKTEKDFIDLSNEIYLEDEWNEVDIGEAKKMIKVFFSRNNKKFNENSKTEMFLSSRLDGFNFIGFADRIDFSSDGLEIIDYKTGKSQISPKHREWQLGFYALAASDLGKVRRITLDMLRMDKPLEFEVDDSGNALPVNSEYMKGFDINNVKEELIRMANKLKKAYEEGFKPCSVEDNCEFCNEYIYNL